MEISAGCQTYRYDDGTPVRAMLNGEALAYVSTSPLTVQVERFAQAIRDGQADLSDAALGVEVVPLLAQIDKSTAA